MLHKSLPLLLGISLAFASCSQRGIERSEPISTGCVRGEPESLLVSQSDFKKSSPGEAQETVQTDSRIKLTIRHFGCTHYALDFEFTWPDARMPEPRISFNQAADVLDKLPLKETYRPVIKSLTSAMRKLAREPYKQPMVMSETETLTATTPALNVLRVRYDVAL